MSVIQCTKKKLHPKVIDGHFSSITMIKLDVVKDITPKNMLQKKKLKTLK